MQFSNHSLRVLEQPRSKSHLIANCNLQWKGIGRLKVAENTYNRRRRRDVSLVQFQKFTLFFLVFRLVVNHSLSKHLYFKTRTSISLNQFLNLNYDTHFSSIQIFSNQWPIVAFPTNRCSIKVVGVNVCSEDDLNGRPPSPPSHRTMTPQTAHHHQKAFILFQILMWTW